MVLDARKLKDALLLAFVVGLLLTGGEPKAVNALPGFSDHTGPTEMNVSELERLDSGCREAVSGYARSSVSGGTYSQVTFVETGDPDADLSAWVERTSPPGADLSTFRVHVESSGNATGRNESNRSCEAGVQYRLEVTTAGGSPEGVLPDAHGIRILWLENGEYAGCSGSYTGPLRSGCSQLRPQDGGPDRTWANATA
ncbi:hypothetical protein M0R89_17145 [Halorussus limi]|uniref:Uncharacterized protein n=1 Tax=Halorussus limi TaxID=2938695 RepID=A0A8U0HTZ9_9EURY|nr:hypothetical protein [Halorussus limi]UPV74251.1 hypothetical protein M0R89_17145 [Halorussus limi]